MKKLIYLLAFASVAHGQTLTNSVTFTLTDWLQTSYANRPVTIRGLSTPRTNPPYIAINFLLNTNSGTTGAFTLTNVLDGTYQVTIAGAATPTVFSIYVPTNQGAVHSASSLLTTSIVDNATTAYTKAQANSLFASRAGTNIVLTTNSGIVFINSTASGGGGGSPDTNTYATRSYVDETRLSIDGTNAAPTMIWPSVLMRFSLGSVLNLTTNSENSGIRVYGDYFKLRNVADLMHVHGSQIEFTNTPPWSWNAPTNDYGLMRRTDVSTVSNALQTAIDAKTNRVPLAGDGVSIASATTNGIVFDVFTATGAGGSVTGSFTLLPGYGMLMSTNGTTNTATVNTNLMAERAWVTNRETIINVKDFGATGDGSTDDTAAIQAAVNYAMQDSIVSETSLRTATNRTRGVVYFPAGTYRTTQDIILSNENPHLRGVGQFRSVIKPDAGVSGIVTTNAPRYGIIEDLGIIGAGATPTAGTVGIDLIGTHTNGLAIPAPYLGFWNIRNVYVGYFDVGLRGNKLQDSSIAGSFYHNNTGVVLTNAIHGVEFTGTSRFNRTNHFTLADLRACRIWVRDCDLSDDDTATNVFRIQGAIEQTTIMGRVEVHKPSVRVFDFVTGQVPTLNIDNFQVETFGDAEGWNFYFGDAYTNNLNATLTLSGGAYELTNGTFIGAQARVPSGTSVKLINNGGNSLFIAGFTNGVHFTNFYAGADVEFQDTGRRSLPNSGSFPLSAHQPFFYRPSPNGEESWNVALYWTNGLLTNVPITEPWQKIRDGILPEVGDTVVWTGPHSFSAGLSNRIRLNNTNSTVTHPVLSITSENVSGNNAWQIVASDSSANATAKTFRFGGVNFHPSLNPVTLMLMSQGSSNRATISYGGGTSVGSPANDHVFYSGLQSTNGSGAVVARIWDSGGFSVGSTVTAPTDPGDDNIRAEGVVIIGGTPSATNHAARIMDVHQGVQPGTNLTATTNGLVVTLHQQRPLPLALVAGPVTNDVVAATNMSATFSFPFAVTLAYATVTTREAPATTGLILDVNTNGVSIFSNTNKLTVSTGTTGNTNSSFNSATIPANARITIDVDQAPGSGSGRAPTAVIWYYPQ